MLFLFRAGLHGFFLTGSPYGFIKSGPTPLSSHSIWLSTSEDANLDGALDVK